MTLKTAAWLEKKTFCPSHFLRFYHLHHDLPSSFRPAYASPNGLSEQAGCRKLTALAMEDMNLTETTAFRRPSFHSGRFHSIRLSEATMNRYHALREMLFVEASRFFARTS